jgi:RNA polymerase sigma-70 factor (ECF subfamily)
VRFETTSWSLIVQAQADDSAEARAAMSRLFVTYWPPVYAFIRCRGQSPPDAEELAQAYFARFFEKGYARDFRPEAGRFRTFLRVSVSHFMANEWDRERTMKRGGAAKTLALDAATAEERYQLEPTDGLTPEAIFERNWAGALLGRCLERLREEEKAAGRQERFAVLKRSLVGDDPAGYKSAARELGMGEPAVRVAVHRLRKRFGGVLREEVLRTVTDPADVDSEIRWLLTAVRGEGEGQP